MISLNYRRQGELKKAYYRRLAQIRKTKWLSSSKNHEESFKFHFMKRVQDDTDTAKTKKISKNQPKSQQKIRNRMAAQQSRERHRTYVQELQQKVKMYEQIIQKQGLLCKNCRKDLVSQATESEEIAQSHHQEERALGIKQEGIQSYLKEEIIRIDNDGATTPYGIFFIICMIAVITVFSFTPSSPVTSEARILTNYYSNAQQTKQQVSKQANIQDLPNFIDFIKTKTNSISQQRCTHAQRTPVKKNLQSYTPSRMQGWTKVGKYICSKPEILMNDCQANKPQFWLVHTQRNRTQQVKDTQNENYKIEYKEWQRVEISQCFLGASL